MSERQAFLRAIAADPADDTVRLAYADWLDEHEGVDDGRAEFIRVQVELHHRQQPVSVSSTGRGQLLRYDHGDDYDRLRARERALLATHPEWRPLCTVCKGKGIPTLPYHDDRCSECEGTGRIGTLRRGFVETITAPRLADVLERVTSALELRPDNRVRPTARAKAWLTHFPTATRLVAADRVPTRTPAGFSTNSFCWVKTDMNEATTADLPAELFYAVKSHEPIWCGASFVAAFATAANANDALAAALARLAKQ